MKIDENRIDGKTIEHQFQIMLNPPMFEVLCYFRVRGRAACSTLSSSHTRLELRSW